MARDYKHRAQNRGTNGNRRRANEEPNGVGVFKWMLVTALIIGFVVFLVYLKSPGFQKTALLAQNQSNEPAVSPEKADPDKKPQGDEKPKDKKPEPPQFDFYTILPKKEVVVPDHEIKTRTREEQVGKNKKASYVIKAGSSKDFNEADQLKAKLALMGIESKIHKAKVESATWYTVTIGPYNQMSSVNGIISRLQKNGMKPVTAEVQTK